MRGLSLVELLVATFLGIFLLGGLLTLEQGTKRSFGNQNLLTQLQDGERLAMTLMAEVVESAGYFPNPALNTLNGSLPVSAPFVNLGQSVYGVSNATAGGDSLTIRFLTASGDGTINCVGGTNTSGAQVLYVNTFSVVSGQLVCAVNGAAAVPLVSNVQSMSVLYGVKTNFSVTNTSADSYLTAAQMTAVDWSNVNSVRVTLVFVNPLAGQAGQPATISFSRVICVMNKCGVNV